MVQNFKHINYIQCLIFQQAKMIETSEVDQKIFKAISCVSNTRNYQKKLYAFLGMIEIIVSFNSIINLIVFTNPLFECYGRMVSEAEYCENRSKCNYINNFTGTYHAGLFCENRGERMALQSTFALGCIIGLLVMPLFNNTKGRRRTINQCMLSILIGNLLLFFGIYFQMYKLIAFGQLITAFGSIALSLIGYCVNYDYLSDDMRDDFAYIYCGSWVVADIVVLFFYTFFPSWIFFMLGVCIIPGICFYAYFLSFFLESPHYYIMSRGDLDRAKDVIKQLAVVNKASHQEYFQSMKAMKQLGNLMGNTVKHKASAFETFRVIFSNSQYVKALFCLIFIRMAYFSFYYGAQSCLERTGFNFGVSLFLAGIGEFTGYLSGSFLFTKWSRKKVLVATNGATAFIGILFLFKAVEQSALISSIILYLSFTANAFNVAAINLVEAESFCSSIRSTAIGYVFAFAVLIRLAIPFATGYMNQLQIHPIVAASVSVFLLGILPTLAVKQTCGWTCMEQPLDPKIEGSSQQRVSKVQKLSPMKIEMKRYSAAYR